MSTLGEQCVQLCRVFCRARAVQTWPPAVMGRISHQLQAWSAPVHVAGTPVVGVGEKRKWWNGKALYTGTHFKLSISSLSPHLLLSLLLFPLSKFVCPSPVKNTNTHRQQLGLCHHEAIVKILQFGTSLLYLLFCDAFYCLSEHVWDLGSEGEKKNAICETHGIYRKVHIGLSAV